MGCMNAKPFQYPELDLHSLREIYDCGDVAQCQSMESATQIKCFFLRAEIPVLKSTSHSTILKRRYHVEKEF